MNTSIRNWNAICECKREKTFLKICLKKQLFLHIPFPFLITILSHPGWRLKLIPQREWVRRTQTMWKQSKMEGIFWRDESREIMDSKCFIPSAFFLYSNLRILKSIAKVLKSSMRRLDEASYNSKLQTIENREKK